MKLDIASPNIRAILTPSIFLIILVLLFSFAVRLGFTEISSQRNTIAKLQKDENILRQKEALLRDLETTLLSQADLALLTLPGKNPALAIVSQLKNLSSQKAIIIDNIKAGAPRKEESSIGRIDISFDAEGPFLSVLDFSASLKTIAPITTLQKFDLSDAGGGLSRATVSVRSYWADFPEKIPSVSEPVKEFTDEDQEILATFASLVTPSFVEVIPNPPGVRVDPFSF